MDIWEEVWREDEELKEDVMSWEEERVSRVEESVVAIEEGMVVNAFVRRHEG